MVYYFAQNATIEAKKPGDGSAYEIVGAVQEVSVEVSFEAVDLYSFGTIKRIDAARHQASVAVTVNLAKFGDFGTAPDWFWSILDAIGPSTPTGTVGKSISISDTSSFPMFKIAGMFSPTDSNGAPLYMEVVDVYFQNFQWGGALGEYIMENLEGKGSDVKFTDNSANITGWDDPST